MSRSITLHPTLGVNPRLTFCQRCGGEGKDLMLLGNRNYKHVCNACGMVGYGGFDGGRCPKCKSGSYTREELKDHEKLPSPDLCDTCEKEVAEHKAVVEEGGGVYFKCEKCGCSGVVKGHAELAKAVREHAQKAEEKKTGVAPAGWWTEAIHNGKFLPIGVALDDCAQHTVTP